MSGAASTDRLDKLRRLHEADPDDADVCYMIAQEFGKADDRAAAIEWYDRCLDLDAGYSYAYFFKAIALSEQGDRPGAVETLRAGLARAHESGTPKAVSELTALLEEYSG
ncbi:MAG: hypothetical protein H6814_11095 [Phycisphaeraceae bacterium]|nr:hypothetical protein [Phycisphaeraceae bacterium]